MRRLRVVRDAQAGAVVTGEPTAPVSIPDLLAAIEQLQRVRTSIGCVTYHGETLAVDTRDLIVRGVRDLAAEVKVLTIERNGAQHQARVNFDAMRDLAARVETLEQAMEFYADSQFWNGKVALMDAGARARAALAGQSTTEQTDPYRDWRFGVSFIEDDVIVRASAPGDTDWRTMLTVSRPASQSTTEQP